ncbi:hypothetical protein Ahy_A08g040623 isoform I [Arachis hypogaea]|uniref:Uncharacterized protein n=1 Tax=Arachis hypogaea TaxID=3818 RepID=A0A445BZS1_ARAHY|nr:hypothetical protein Ahy_A08g040623 isoform I [Arachis hypogaea]
MHLWGRVMSVRRLRVVLGIWILNTSGDNN